MLIRELNRLWRNAIAAPRNLRHRTTAVNHVDSVLLSDAMRDADFRLLNKLDEIKREERGLVKLILSA